MYTCTYNVYESSLPLIKYQRAVEMITTNNISAGWLQCSATTERKIRTDIWDHAQHTPHAARRKPHTEQEHSGN